MQNGAEVHAQECHGGLIAIRAASMNGNLHLFDEMYGTDHLTISHRSRIGTTSLQAAALLGHAEIVERLLSRAETVVNEQAPPGKGFTSLQAACIQPHLHIARRLLEAGTDVNTHPSDHDGITALHAAAKSGSLLKVALSIHVGADVNGAPAQGYGVTVLQGVCRKGHSDIAKQLCYHSAIVSARACIIGGRTALQAAVEIGHQDVVTFLLDRGAFANKLPAYIDGLTTLRAAENGSFNDVRTLLIDAGADNSFLNHTQVDNSPIDDWSLQYRAERISDPALNVETMPTDPRKDISKTTAIEDGPPAFASFPTTSGLTEAAALGDEVTVEFLLVKAAENAVNSLPALLYGRTALQAAAENGHDAVVARLMHARADPNGRV